MIGRDGVILFIGTIATALGTSKGQMAGFRNLAAGHPICRGQRAVVVDLENVNLSKAMFPTLA
jgi:hypothetical protein